MRSGKLFLLVVACISTLGVPVVLGVNVSNLLTGYGSCTSESRYFDFYIEGSSYTRYPNDTFTNSNKTSLISDGGSAVQIWRNNGVLGGCTNWERVSNIVKKNSDRVLALQNFDGCIFNKPSTYLKIDDPGKIDAQIHYDIGYYEQGGSSSLNTKWGYKYSTTDPWTCYKPTGTPEIVQDISQCPDRTVTYSNNLKHHTGECANFRLFRCGDGLVNGYNGSTSYENGIYTEECEPGNVQLALGGGIHKPGFSGNMQTASGVSIGIGQMCDTTCHWAPVPQCSSQYNGSGYYSLSYTGNWLSPTTPGLCSGGTVTGFQSYQMSAGGPRYYEWSCYTSGITLTGVTTSGCNAAQNWCGDGILNTGYETCDPALPSSIPDGYTCNNSCQLAAQCSSEYSGSYYTTGYTGPWLSSGMNLCIEGTVTGFSASLLTPGGRYYQWNCTTGGVVTTGCNAAQNWCGDGLIQTGEECDPPDQPYVGGEGNNLFSKIESFTEKYNSQAENNDSKSGSRSSKPSSNSRSESGYSCNYLCQRVVTPQCTSEYNGTGQYTYTNSGQALVAGNYLCSGGTITGFSAYQTPAGSGPRYYEWGCTTGGITTTGCDSYQNWCGDGIFNTGYEACDPNDPYYNGWGSDGCSNTCQPINNPPQCNSEYTGYYSFSYTGQWLNSLMTELCTNGSVTSFQTNPDPIPSNPTSPIQYSWSCTTTGGTATGCNAVQNWCGDGIVSNGEQCDPNDPGHNGWGSDGCSSACKPINNPPLCSSEYSGSYYTTGYTGPWLNSGMSNLCDNGSVTSFQTNPDPIPSNPTSQIQYQWSCTTTGGTATGCNAVQNWCGDGILQTNHGEQCDPNDPSHQGWGDGCSSTCQPTTTPPPPPTTGHLVIDKTVVGSGIISNTGDLIRWNIRVTAVSGDVTNFTIEDILPSILAYSDFDELHNPGLTILSPTITQVNNGWEIKWDVVGTLTEGNYIEIQVVTKAVQMPEPKVHYENVGCVIYQDTQTCDPEPIPGHLQIIKTLIGSGLISSTGDIVKWRIRVTAIGEDFSGFNIIDRLPNILSYSSYTVIHDGGLTISDPFISGNEIVWTPGGTLSAGEYVEIELETKANSMPEGGYVNVACVKPNPGEETCSPVRVGSVKIEKTLVGDRIITNTGDTITWNIIVTALSGGVTNPIITDILPSILSYSGYTVIVSGGLNVSSPIISGNEIIWNTQGTLAEDSQIIIRLETSVTQMPDHDYENVACVKYYDHGNIITCDDEDLPAPHLRIKKTFIDGTTGKQVQAGDVIVYQITFGNSGDAAATITSIKDFLPNTVEYSGSAIFISGSHVQEYMTGWSGVVHSGHSVQGVYLDIFTGITLNPGETGYIILTGIVLSGTNQDNRTNFACIYLNGNNIDCDDVTHQYANVSCIPTLSPPSFPDVCPSDNSEFSTNVTCNSTGGEADLEIICNGTVVNSGHATQLTGTCSSTINNTNHTVQCKVNGSLTGANGESCQNVFRRNTKSCGGGGGSSCFVAGTEVLMADGTNLPIEKVKIGDFVMGENGTKNKVEEYDRPKLNQRNLWSINGSECFVSDEHPFKTVDGWKSFDPELSKKEVEHALNSYQISEEEYNELMKIEKLDIGDVLIAQNGKEIKITSLKACENVSPDTQLYNFVLTGENNTYYANGYLVHNKGGGGGSSDPKCERIERASDGSIICESTLAKAYFKLTCDNEVYYSFDYSDGKNTSRNYKFTNCKNPTNAKCYVSKKDDKNGSWKSNNTTCELKATEAQDCFNVNAGNFSIEEGEILPFYWNMINLDEKYKDTDNYTVIKNNSSYKDARNIYNGYEGSECPGDEGKIAKDSMVCTFKIYDGSGYYKGIRGNKTVDNPMYTIVGPCLSNGSAMSEPLIQARYKAMKRTYCQDDPNNCYFYFGENYNSAVLPTAVYYIENFGSGDRFFVDAGGGGEEFKVSNNSEPNNKKAYGEYMIQLTNVEYLRCEDEKWKVETIDNVCQSNFTLTNSYTVQKTPSGNLRASTTELRKYKSYTKDGEPTFDTYLDAISPTAYNKNSQVEKAMDDFITKYERLAVRVKTEGSNSTLKGQDIRKVPGKNIYFVSGDVTINGGTVNKPFTVVQKKGNAIVSGNLDNNMMLLTKGNITFKGNCITDQKVKGIFYAGRTLNRSQKYRNNNIDSSTWCTNGGLHVKGVLIGDGFSDLMDKSRSNLNNWFHDTNNKIRKSTIMNGASVLIEYSPSVFTTSTMPPGAEEFVTALSIYKQ